MVDTEERCKRYTTTEYKVIVDSNIEAFNKEASKLLSEGYFIIDGSFTVIGPIPGRVHSNLYQALAKDTEHEENDGSND